MLAVVVVAIGLYAHTLDGEFVLDDNELIVTNPLAHSLDDAVDAFGAHFLHGFVGAGKLYYRPLITVSYQLDYTIWGADPFGFRLTNVLLYAAVCAMVFALARAICGNNLTSGVAAMVFVVMPGHSESVGWISGRTDLIACLFMLGSLLAFIAACKRRAAFHRPLAGLSSLLLCGALFSKEIAVILPVVMILYVWCFVGPLKRSEALKWCAALVPAIVVYLLVRRYALGGMIEPKIAWMLKERLLRVGIVYATYLRMLFIPAQTRLIYDAYPLASMKPTLLPLAAWMVPIGLVAMTLRSRRISPVLCFALGWVFLNLLPVSDILPLHQKLPAERFAFLAGIGSSLVIGLAARRLLELRPARLRTWPVVAAAVLIGYGLYSAAYAVEGAEVYRSNTSWALYVHRTRPNWWLYRSTAAQFLLRSGDLKTAVSEYEASLDLGTMKGAKRAPFDFKVGVWYATLGEYPNAEKAFERTVKYLPGHGKAWRNLGKVYLRQGKYEESVESFRKAFQIIEPTPDDLAEFNEATRLNGR